MYIRDRRIAAQAQAFNLLGAELSALARLPGGARPKRHHGASVQHPRETTVGAMTRSNRGVIGT